MTPEKQNVITSLLEAYDIKTTAELQDALKDLLGGSIQGMLESELDEQLGYEKSERTCNPKSNYRVQREEGQDGSKSRSLCSFGD